MGEAVPLDGGDPARHPAVVALTTDRRNVGTLSDAATRPVYAALPRYRTETADAFAEMKTGSKVGPDVLSDTPTEL